MASSNFWKTLPGIITAIATLIGSITGLLMIIPDHWVGGGAPGPGAGDPPPIEECHHLGAELEGLGGHLGELHGQLEGAHEAVARGDRDMEPEVERLEQQIGEVEKHREEIQQRFDELDCRRALKG